MKGIPLKSIKNRWGSPAFKIILFSWMVAFLSAVTIITVFPQEEDFSFLNHTSQIYIHPAYSLFSSLLSSEQTALDETTVLEKISSPFVILSLKASSVEENIDSRASGLLDAHLSDIEASDDPYFRDKGRTLRLWGQYHGEQYEAFVAGCNVQEPLPEKLIAPLVHALIMTRRQEEAQNLFNEHVHNRTLSSWANTIPQASLISLIRGLPLSSWQFHLDLLQTNNRLSELRSLLRMRNAPERGFLLEAMSLYNQKEYDRASRQLNQIRSPLLSPWKEYMSLKIDARQDRQQELAVRSKQHRYNKALYLTILSDLGGILIASGKDLDGLAFYTRYIEEVDSQLEDMPSFAWERLWHNLPLSGQNERYWQIIYRSAWLYYKLDQRDEHRRLLEKCLESSIHSIRQSSLVWLSENPAETRKDLAPFGYDYARLNAPLSARHLRPFLNRISGELALSDKELTQLKDLCHYGLYRQAIDYTRWLMRRHGQDRATRNTLAVCEAILLFRQQLYPQAFLAFRQMFPDYSTFILPRYLSFIVLPVVHQDTIGYQAAENGLDPFLVTSLIRQESFFMANAVSPANAYGLMQLLLRTAREVSTGNRRLTVQDLLNPELNIELGCRYLKMMMDRYQNQPHLALAAYNAGPERVDQWLNLLGRVSAEEFIELIPFSETRMYVKNIMRNVYFYRYYRSDLFQKEAGS